MSELPVSEIRVTAETEPFWNATADGRLELPVCDACGFVIWYPRSFCPECQSRDVTWTPMSGGGRVHAFSIVRGGVGGRWREQTPYVVAYVELDEGPRLLTNIVDVDPASVEIDMAVRAVFDPTGEDPGSPAIVRFTAAG